MSLEDLFLIVKSIILFKGLTSIDLFVHWENNEWLY